MAIEYTVENLEGVDESVKSLYKEAETGGYVLDVAGVVPESQFKEINQERVTAKSEAERRRRAVERMAETVGDPSLRGDDLIAAVEAMKSGQGQEKSSKDTAAQQAIIDQIKAAHQAELEAARGEVTGMKMSAAKAQFQSELQAAGFPAKAASMFAAANMNRVNIDDSGEIRIMTEKGTPLAGSGADGFANFGDLSKELAAAMPEFLVDKGKGGGGKAPATGGGSTAPNGKFGTLANAIPGFSDLPKN